MTTGDNHDTTEPHRLTPTERLHEVTMAAMHRQPAAPIHETSITRNAKGQPQIEVTVRGTDPDAVAAKASALYAQLAIDHPYHNGSTP